MEMKVGLIKENGELAGAMVMIVDDNGIPTILGGIDEPIDVKVINRNQLMNGLHQLPQEFLMTVDQNSAYEAPAFIEEIGNEGRIDLIE